MKKAFSMGGNLMKWKKSVGPGDKQPCHVVTV